MSINESIVEEAALTWFGELGYDIGHGSHLAPGDLRVKAGEPYVAEATP
ncbi:MAG: hypothetical protein AABY81_04345 [Pseudomonadota bacterium]